MDNVTDIKVSSRGQMSLPATVRHRWGLDAGGTIGQIDLGDVVLLVPGGVQRARAELLSGITDEIWQQAAEGFGDPDLATM
jgi:bifunctional DNA-binding transcriptional regulator/antitoxin component of YhaV-PrlF toxin-antitoxin module